MIGIDTNVLVRYITQDDPAQSAKATKFMESLSPDVPGFVSMIVVVELVWVMQACYHASRDAIATMLETLLRTDALVVERAEIIWQALRRTQSTQADFADCLIERCGHAEGCTHTVTFDRNAVKTVDMRVVG
jgi:predicted nucleic-acid-binding protein